MTRDELIARARELGVFPFPEDCTDEQLRDAIAAEQACAVWMARWEQLPTEAAQADALRRLSDAFRDAAS